MIDEYFSLSIGLFEINWRKNIFQDDDFESLFTPSDLNYITYYNNDGDEIIMSKSIGYSKKVKDVIPRLNLLGYGYDKLASQLDDHINGFPAYLQLPKVNWNEFLKCLSNLEIKKIKWLEHEGDADSGEFLKRRILAIPQLKKLNKILGTGDKDDLMIFEQIDPLIILAAVASNPSNQELLLEWRYDKLINTEIPINHTYLIITEGISDSRILKKSLEILYPDLNCFFNFIDMKDNYPFGGVGNLSNFFRGLLKISTNRKMIFIFDNDTAGIYEVSKLKKLNTSQNFKLFTLPYLPAFENFRTKGDDRLKKESINGKAVAIEMFLDLKYKKDNEPIIHWKEQHQGALENKSEYEKIFKIIKGKEINDYDFSKLKYLLDAIIDIITE